jgi:AraC-like DNA-binding protein
VSVLHERTQFPNRSSGTIEPITTRVVIQVLMVEFRAYPPSNVLASFVQFFWTLKGRALPDQPVYPDGRPEIVLHLDECCEELRSGTWTRQPSTVIAGQLRSAFSLRGHSVHCFGLRLMPGALPRFFDVDPSELCDRTADAGLDRLRERVGNETDTASRIRVTEEFLRERLRSGPPSLAESAVTQILARQGVVRIGAIAGSLGTSIRTLERRFHAEVGLGPKTLARIVRCQRALRLMGSGWSGAAAALECGYFDQAHLLRDLREWLGRKPELADVAFFQDPGEAVEAGWQNANTGQELFI